MRLHPIIRRALGMPSATPADDRPAPTPPPGGFQHAPHRRRGPLGWRILAGLAIFLIVLSGVINVIIRPVASAFTEPEQPPAPVETADPAEVSALAVAFTADYWSYSSHHPEAREAALARWTGGRVTFEGIDGVQGPGQLRADLVTAGPVASDDDELAVVQTLARVTPAALTGEEPAAPEVDPDAPQLPSAADPGPATGDPWTAQPARWLSLDVVVQDIDGELVVTGAALSGDDPAVITRTTTETDAQLTGQTKANGLPEDLFGAYAAGDAGQLTYLTTPNVLLDGLSGVVELADVTGWSMATDRATTGGTRYATAEVTWQLTGTQLQFRQAYALALSDPDGRWQLASIGPRIEE